MFTFDPGFTSTASCESQITYIDGDEGVLLHRGYPIDQLAEQSSFLEVCYLLLNGELPTASRSSPTSTSTITRHTMLHEQLATASSQGFRRDAHPMAIMCGVVGALCRPSTHDSTDIDDPHAAQDQRPHRLIAKMPTIAARAYKYSIGQPFVYPRNELELHRQLPAHDASRCRPRTTRSNPVARHARWTASSSSTPTTSRTPRPRPCAWPARRAPTRSPASPPASPACGARRMAAPTRRRSRCSREIGTAEQASANYIERREGQERPASA